MLTIPICGNLNIRVHSGHLYAEVAIYLLKQVVNTGMVVHGQLFEPAVCFSELQACEELIHSFIRLKPNNICLDSKLFLIFMNQTIQFMVFTIDNGHFIV